MFGIQADHLAYLEKMISSDPVLFPYLLVRQSFCGETYPDH